MGLGHRCRYRGGADLWWALSSPILPRRLPLLRVQSLSSARLLRRRVLQRLSPLWLSTLRVSLLSRLQLSPCLLLSWLPPLRLSRPLAQPWPLEGFWVGGSECRPTRSVQAFRFRGRANLPSATIG